MDAYLLIIMDNEPSIHEIFWCSSVSDGKKIAEGLLENMNGSWLQHDWLGEDHYPYRTIQIEDAGDRWQYEVEIMPADRISKSTEYDRDS